MSSLFLFSPAFADTILLKNEKEIKGLVVEKHSDRIILSTEKGEIPILLSGIKDIRYDDPEQNFFKIGKEFEAEKKYGEALAYYEKALELNPDMEEAQQAAAGMRNHFWATSTEGPVSEIEKQEVLHNDSWSQGRTAQTLMQKEAMGQARLLRDSLGLVLNKKGDWVELELVQSKKDGAISGLRKNDKLVSIDGESLRYLGVDAIIRKMLTPRFSNFTLEYERNIFMRSSGKNLGIKFALEYEGLKINSVKENSYAEMAGLKSGDWVVAINGISTRYMPLKKVNEVLRDSKERTVFTVRRQALLMRR